MRPRALLRALPLLGLLGGPVLAAGPTDIARVDEFIDAPRALFGRTQDHIERVLGKPLATETLPDAVQEWSYPGVAIRTSAAGAVQRVEITDPRFRLPWGLTIGTPRGQVERILGEPQQMTDTRSLYLYSDGFPNTVEFYFRDNRVGRIRWTYWVH